MIYSRIIGTGSHLPEKVVTNLELEKTLDTSDQWIQDRTGIKQRYIAGENETTCSLAEQAARRAMKAAGKGPGDIDLIILATTTPDQVFPSTSCLLQSRLDIHGCAAFDIQAVCTGFVYALTQADNMIRLGQATCALVIGAEIYSRILDWEDRGTCVLFGDGAGAVVLRAETTNGVERDRGIISTKLGADGRFYDSLYVDGGPATTGTAGYVRMQGKEVFKHAVEHMSSLVLGLLKAEGLTTSDLDWLVPHQANIRIINKVGERLDLSDEKMLSPAYLVRRARTMDFSHAPLAMNQAMERQLFKPGDLIGLTAMGGGFTFGAALLRW